MSQSFDSKIRVKMDRYVHAVYKATKEFPRDEIFGVTSQLRRSTLSVILNYIEGYARSTDKDKLKFYNISYASLKESKYLLHFSLTEKYLSKTDYDYCLNYADEIGAMLWSILSIK